MFQGIDMQYTNKFKNIENFREKIQQENFTKLKIVYTTFENILRPENQLLESSGRSNEVKRQFE